MLKLKDVQVKDEKFSFSHISLNKLSGKKIKDIYGNIALPFGDPLFTISFIVLEDGTKLWVGGEHDVAFIDDDIIDQDEMENLSEQLEKEYEREYGG